MPKRIELGVMLQYDTIMSVCFQLSVHPTVRLPWNGLWWASIQWQWCHEFSWSSCHPLADEHTDIRSVYISHHNLRGTQTQTKGYFLIYLKTEGYHNPNEDGPDKWISISLSNGSIRTPIRGHYDSCDRTKAVHWKSNGVDCAPPPSLLRSPPGNRSLCNFRWYWLFSQ